MLASHLLYTVLFTGLLGQFNFGDRLQAMQLHDVNKVENGQLMAALFRDYSMLAGTRLCVCVCVCVYENANGYLSVKICTAYTFILHAKYCILHTTYAAFSHFLML